MVKEIQKYHDQAENENAVKDIDIQFTTEENKENLNQKSLIDKTLQFSKMFQQKTIKPEFNSVEVHRYNMLKDRNDTQSDINI